MTSSIKAEVHNISPHPHHQRRTEP